MVQVNLDLDLYPKQLQALRCEAQEVLFGGATRGGKSHFIRVMLIANCLEVPGIQCLVLRRLYEDVLNNHMEGPSSFKQMLKPLIDLKRVIITENKVRFLHGNDREGSAQPDSLITLSHCATEEAALKAQGVPKDILVFEEACQILERYIRFIRGWVTTTEEIKGKLPLRLKGQLPKIYYTANPIGSSVGYFRRNFVHPAKMGEVFRAPDDDGGFSRVYIEARVEDNASEDTAATERRVRGMGDAGYVDALLEANWDAPIGDFFKQYDNRKHCVPDHAPPEKVKKYMSFDWGSSDPFAVAWWYVSDGEEFESLVSDASGKERVETLWYPRGAIVAYREWYGCTEQDCAKGLELPNKEIARGIIERTHEDTTGLVVTDAFPFMAKGSYKRGREYRIADEFAEEGVYLTRANTQRVYGWKCVRDRLIGKDGIPMLYFQQQCKYLRDYLPMIGRHKAKPEDAEESGEATHCCLAPDTLVDTLTGPREVSKIRKGERVVCGDGVIRPATFAAETRKGAETVELHFENGSKVVCTPDHQVLTTKGWKSAIDIAGYACKIDLCSLSLLQSRFKASSDTGMLSTEERSITREDGSDCTLSSGHTTTSKSQRAATSTTLMGTGIITRLKTYSASLLETTSSFMRPRRREFKLQDGTSIRAEDLLRLGTRVKRAGRGIKRTTKKTSRISSTGEKTRSVSSVEKQSSPITESKDFAQINASQPTQETTTDIQLKKSAPTAGKLSRLANIAQQQRAQSLTQSPFDTKTLKCLKVAPHERIDTFCICEPVSGSFKLANGLIVSNSDIIRYACATKIEATKIQKAKKQAPKGRSVPVSDLVKQAKRSALNARRRN